LSCVASARLSGVGCWCTARRPWHTCIPSWPSRSNWRHSEHGMRHEDSMCSPQAQTPTWLRATRGGLHIELACAKPRRLWRLFRVEALCDPSRRRTGSCSRGRRVAKVASPGDETSSLTPSVASVKTPWRRWWTHHPPPGSPGLLSRTRAASASSTSSMRCQGKAGA